MVIMTSYLVQFRIYRRLLFTFWILRNFELPLGAYGQRTLFILGSLKARSGLTISDN